MWVDNTFFTKNKENLRVKYLEGGEGKYIAHLPLNTPLNLTSF